jgi:hypothetical protein
MKNPTLKGWAAIIGALLALAISVIAALSDSAISPEEAQDMTTKTGELIDTIQQETAE